MIANSLLLEFSLLTDMESASTKLPASNTLQSDLAFVDSWRMNREGLHGTVRQLLDSEHLKVFHHIAVPNDLLKQVLFSSTLPPIFWKSRRFNGTMMVFCLGRFLRLCEPMPPIFPLV
jgi:hypothetical protein